MEKRVKVIIAETVGMNVPMLVLACLVPSRLIVLLALVFLAVTAAIMAIRWSAWKRYLLVSVGFCVFAAATVSVNKGFGSLWFFGIYSLVVSMVVDCVFDTGYFDFLETVRVSGVGSDDSLDFIDFKHDASRLAYDQECSPLCYDYSKPAIYSPSCFAHSAPSSFVSNIGEDVPASSMY